MKDVFDTYDTQNQGFIKTSLLGNILRTIGFNPFESDIKRATAEVDPQSKNNFWKIKSIDWCLFTETDQLKFPDYVVAVLSIPTRVLDKDIIPAFQVFDLEKRGLLEADEILKSLTNVGEKLDEVEANTFKESININELGLFDYNGKK
jgi:calmodulin